MDKAGIKEIKEKLERLTAFRASRGLAHHSNTGNAGGLSFWDRTRPGVSPPRWPSNHSEQGIIALIFNL